MRKKLVKFIWFFRFIRKYRQLKEERKHWIQVKLPSYKKHMRHLEGVIKNERALNTELKQSNAELRNLFNAQRTELDKVKADLTKIHRHFNDVFVEVPASSNDNGNGQECNKVRCCTKQEAKDFAYQVKCRTRQEFTVYERDKCPKNKRTSKPYWHITHSQKWLRGIYGQSNVQ